MARLAWLVTRFGLVGVASAAVYFVCLFLWRPFVTDTILLTAISYVVSAVFNFLAQSRFTFKVNAGQSSLARYAAMHGCASSRTPR
mgnify:CR=1 FL=1